VLYLRLIKRSSSIYFCLISCSRISIEIDWSISLGGDFERFYWSLSGFLASLWSTFCLLFWWTSKVELWLLKNICCLLSFWLSSTSWISSACYLVLFWPTKSMKSSVLKVSTRDLGSNRSSSEETSFVSRLGLNLIFLHGVLTLDRVLSSKLAYALPSLPKRPVFFALGGEDASCYSF